MTCWIIRDERQRVERGATGRLCWLAAPDFTSAWTDPEKATRFAREEDAEAMIVHLGGNEDLRAFEWDFERAARQVRPSEGGGGT